MTQKIKLSLPPRLYYVTTLPSETQHCC